MEKEMKTFLGGLVIGLVVGGIIGWILNLTWIYQLIK